MLFALLVTVCPRYNAPRYNADSGITRSTVAPENEPATIIDSDCVASERCRS